MNEIAARSAWTGSGSSGTRSGGGRRCPTEATATDLALGTGVFIEAGTHQHAIRRAFSLYVHEPGGDRVELRNLLTRPVLTPTGG